MQIKFVCTLGREMAKATRWLLTVNCVTGTNAMGNASKCKSNPYAHWGVRWQKQRKPCCKGMQGIQGIVKGSSSSPL